MQVEIRTGSDLSDLARRLRAVDRELPRLLTKRLRDEIGRPLQRGLKASVRGLPAKGPQSTRLRARTASAVKLRVRTSGRSAGMRVWVATGQLGPQRALPALMNKGQWRHPVFGNRSNWVAQTTDPGWWDDPIQGVQRNAAGTVDRVAQDIVEGIEG